MCVWLGVSCLVIWNLWVCSVAYLQEIYSVYYCTSICMCGWMFPAFVIQNLWVCSIASLQQIYSVRCCSSICVCGWVFPTFVIQNLWVVHNSLAEKNVQHRLLRQYMYVWLDVSCLCNLDSLGVLSSLPTRTV